MIPLEIVINGQEIQSRSVKLSKKKKKLTIKTVTGEKIKIRFSQPLETRHGDRGNSNLR